MEGGLLDGSLSSVVAAAHELKSPLALVRQLAFALEDEGLSTSERQRLVEQIRLTSERALRLTSDLTRTVRLDDALFQLEPVNIKTLCTDVAFQLTPLYHAYGRSIGVRRQRHVPLVVGNRELLHRVMTNFADNALHYGDSKVEFRIAVRNHGRTVRVGVRDYGPAVPTALWQSLVRTLAYAPQSVHARPQSSGLGLYIAGQFAHVMGGQIGAVRHQDGATFYIDITASRQLQLL